MRAVQAFSVSPTIVDLQVEPGKVQEGKIDVTNTTDVTKTYYVSVQKFVAKGEDGQQDFLPESDTTGIPSWISPASRSVTLRAGEHASLSYAVRVPVGVEPGGHYAALFFSDQPSRGEGSSVAVSAKVGVLFLVRVPGNIVESARVEGFSSLSERMSHLPAQFEFRVRNLGNTHIRPEGPVVVRNIFGIVVAKIPANPTEAAVLPNSVRRLGPAWTKTFDARNASGILGELKAEWNNFAIGPYTAEVQATYGGQQQQLTATTSFWVMPWMLLITIGLGILILIILLKVYGRMAVRSAIKKGKRP